jgi:hypothetical protein
VAVGRGCLARPVVAVAASVLAFSSSGCGSSAQSHLRPAGGEATKSPARILADAVAALRDSHGYVAQGTLRQGGQTTRLKVRAQGPRSLELSLSIHGATAEVIVSGGNAYLRANAAFWVPHFGQRGQLFAERWVEIPPSQISALTNQAGHFAPQTIGRCLGEDHGTLSVAGHTRVDGRPAIVLRDAGNTPGGTPSLVAVAASGTPYPLRDTATGPTRAGGRIDTCNNGKGEDLRGTLTFSQFGHVEVHAPTNVLHVGGSQTV